MEQCVNRLGVGMAAAFIISAYKEPGLLKRLVGRLSGHRCAVHIDAKVDFAPFAQELSTASEVAYLPRHVCHWGRSGHISASIEGLRWFLHGEGDYVVLLTGQCYPLRPLEDFEAWLEGLSGCSVISHSPFPHPRWRHGGFNRVQQFHVRVFGKALHLRLWPRRLPLRLWPYGGSSYWCLSRAAAEYIMETVDRSPELLKFFRHAWIPDEIFFQTILANSPMKDRLIDDDIHHIEWTPHQPSPKVIADPTAALESGKWFARKFADEAVLDKIDARRSQRPAAELGMRSFAGV
jgi:hypothetical protein